MERDEQPHGALHAGTVTRLVAQKKNPKRVTVFIDDTFAFGAHVDLIVEYGVHKGGALDVATQRAILAADSLRSAKETALAYVGRRARTMHEVRIKLVRGGYEEAVADRAVARLCALGYLDDAAYARTYVQARFRHRGYGPGRLRSDLMRRGVAKPLIETVLEELAGQVDLLGAARRHAEKRWPRLASEPNPYKRRKKLSEYLVRRGFSYDLARRVVEELEDSCT